MYLLYLATSLRSFIPNVLEKMLHTQIEAQVIPDNSKSKGNLNFATLTCATEFHASIAEIPV